MRIIDRDGVVEIEVRAITIHVTRDELTPEQVAAQVAEALGEPVWWLDRAGSGRDDFSTDPIRWSDDKLLRERRHGMPAVIAEYERRFGGVA